jgi:hypothetical protein
MVKFEQSSGYIIRRDGARAYNGTESDLEYLTATD